MGILVGNVKVSTTNSQSFVVNNGNAPSIQEDIYNNMPPAGFAGRLFLATDRNRWYRDTGTSWAQIGSVLLQEITGNIPGISGTIQFNPGNNAPSITDGTEIISTTLTPLYSTSRIVIQTSLLVGASNNNATVGVAVFRDSTCILTTLTNIPSNNGLQNVSIFVVDIPNTTSQITYSMRMGPTGNQTATVNRDPSGNFWGGTLASNYIIYELQ